MVFGTERPNSFQDALRLARRILGSNYELAKKPSIDAEAEIIVQAAYRITTGIALSRTEFFARMGDPYPELAGEKVVILAHQRAEGKILQHLTGVQVFLDHEYDVNSSVLVPRPETELLARIATETLLKKGAPIIGIEIGLGSGILSIELLTQFPKLRMIASEVSHEAILVARKNANRILKETPGQGESRLTVVIITNPNEVLPPLSRELRRVGARADFLISNPPYLNSDDQVDAEVALHEPHLALYPKSGDPMFFYKEIARGAEEALKPGGHIFLELAAERAKEINQVMMAAGWSTEIHEDLNGRPRVLTGQIK